jgi:hypothetical protein
VIDAFALFRPTGSDPDIHQDLICIWGALPVSGRQRRSIQGNEHGGQYTKQRNGSSVNQSQHGSSPSLVN